MYKATILSLLEIFRLLFFDLPGREQGSMHRITMTLDEGTKSKSDLDHATFTLGLSVCPYWNRVFHSFSSQLDTCFLLPDQIWTHRWRASQEWMVWERVPNGFMV